MATPAQIIPVLEGLVSFQIGSADGGSIQGSQIVATWVNAVKWLLGQPNFRYLDDLVFTLMDDVDEAGDAGANIGDATHIIAYLTEVLSNDLGVDADAWVAFQDLDATSAFDASAALNNATVAIHSIKDVGVSGVSEFYPGILFGGTSDDGTYGQTGINLATGLLVVADGMDGGALNADVARTWVLTRN